MLTRLSPLTSQVSAAAEHGSFYVLQGRFIWLISCICVTWVPSLPRPFMRQHQANEQGHRWRLDSFIPFPSKRRNSNHFDHCSYNGLQYRFKCIKHSTNTWPERIFVLLGSTLSQGERSLSLLGGARYWGSAARSYHADLCYRWHHRRTIGGSGDVLSIFLMSVGIKQLLFTEPHACVDGRSISGL